MRNSAVWACLRLRADLISTFPVDVYRNFGGDRVEMPKPPVLVTPGGERWDYQDWMYASQVDLDRGGNIVGIITETNGVGLPARIDLQSLDCWSLKTKKGSPRVKYRIDGKDYDESKIWHERQYVIAGCPVGLSPIAYAAWCLREQQSMQDFVLQWFGAGGVPAAHLKNSRKTLLPGEADAIKARHVASVSVGQPIVTGADWEYNPIQAEAVGMEWLEGRRYGLSDIARFFGCPADAIEAAVAGGASVTYANIVQKNLQFLIMNLGPAVARREKNLSKLLPSPRYVKLNTNAMLRMDPLTQAEVIQTRIESRTLTPDEARALDDRPPLTSSQITQFHDLFGQPRQEQPAAPNRELERARSRSMMDVGSFLAEAMRGDG